MTAAWKESRAVLARIAEAKPLTTEEYVSMMRVPPEVRDLIQSDLRTLLDEAQVRITNLEKVQAMKTETIKRLLDGLENLNRVKNAEIDALKGRKKKR